MKAAGTFTQLRIQLPSPRSRHHRHPASKPGSKGDVLQWMMTDWAVECTRQLANSVCLTSGFENPEILNQEMNPAIFAQSPCSASQDCHTITTTGIIAELCAPCTRFEPGSKGGFLQWMLTH